MPTATFDDGFSLYYEELGTGVPLVLISGQNTDHSQWDSVRTRYSDAYRTISFDHRGTGNSDKPDSPPYTTRGFAADVISLLDYLQIEWAHIFGVSMGGRVAQWVAIDHPDRVRSVVLAATTPGDAHGVIKSKEASRSLKVAPTGDAQTDPLIPYLVSDDWADNNLEFVQSIAERRLNPGGNRPIQMHYEASQSHNSWDYLPSIKVPTLVLHGDDDRLNPTANAHLLAERIPNAELYLIANGRHEFFIEFPEETTKIVRDFLSRH